MPVSSILPAKPKSEILQIPFFSTRILSPFKFYGTISYASGKFLLTQTYSVQDSLRMEVLKTTEDLAGEKLGDILAGLAVLA